MNQESFWKAIDNDIGTCFLCIYWILGIQSVWTLTFLYLEGGGRNLNFPQGRKVSIQTDWIPKIQYMQRNQVPVSLSMAFQKYSGPATFRESGWITCLFSPSPTGLGERSLDQSPCISGWSHPSQSWFTFSCSSSFCFSFGPWGAQSGAPMWVSVCIAILRQMKDLWW